MVAVTNIVGLSLDAVFAALAHVSQRKIIPRTRDLGSINGRMMFSTPLEFDLAFKDQTIPDTEWWDSSYAEFEHFVGIGKERVAALVAFLRDRGEHFVANRLLAANGMEHGPRNTVEIV